MQYLKDAAYNTSIWKKTGQPKLIDDEEKTWELSRCVAEFYGTSQNPIRKNLEFIIGLRNQIEHRFVPGIDPHVAGECQALILNFDNMLTSEFGTYYAIRETLAIPLQTTGMRTSAQVDALKEFQGKNYEDIRQFIDVFRSSLSDGIYGDLQYSFRVYLVPKMGNHEKSSDLAYEFVRYDPEHPEEMADLEKQIVLIKDRQIPVANAGKYKPGQIVAQVAAKTGRKFVMHHHTLAWQMYRVRKKGNSADGCDARYCQFDAVHKDYVYTEEWITFLVMKLSNQTEYDKLCAFKQQSRPSRKARNGGEELSSPPS